ncbi:MAG: DUF1579 family protein [Phycisphaerales bacterium]|nr:DUF1579 family protein [Phycisphaerales bacterium]
MKLNRSFSGLTAVGLLAFAAGASEPLEFQPQPAASTSTTQETATPSAIPASATQFLQRLAGEWDGQIEIRRDGAVSSSVVNISSQLQKDGKAVISCFEGYAFGQAFEGGSLLGVNPRTGQFESAWFDHVSGATMRCAAAQTTDDSTFTFAGQLTGKQGRSAKVEQVVKMTDFTHYTNEWFIIAEDGQKTRLMFLEMTRLPEGQLSSAAEKLRSVAEQARLRGAVANVPQQNGADQD